MRGVSTAPAADGPAFPIAHAPADLPARAWAAVETGGAAVSAALSALLGSVSLSDGLRAQAHTASGALFAAGWWVWADAVLTLPHAAGGGGGGAATPPVVPFIRWAPGLLATLSAALMAAVGSSQGGDSYADGVQSTGASVSLFFAFCAAFAAVVGGAGSAVALGGAWLGVATVVQCVLLLGSGLAAFVASEDGGGGGGWGSYAAF